MPRFALCLSTAILCASLGAQVQTLHTFDGDSAGDSLGLAVAAAGDVDGDGHDDLIVGAYLDDNNGTDSGSARVYSGQSGAVLYTFDGTSEGDWFGWAVSGAGDVNGDGYDDLIVGAFVEDNEGIETGSARVFSGQSGAVLYTFWGDAADTGFGESVSGAGDVDGDGYDDVIVGAEYGDLARVFSGRTGSILYSFSGDAPEDGFGCAVSGAGDVNQDGFADLIVGARFDSDNGTWAGSARVFSGKDGSTLYTFLGDSATDWFGDAVSGAGDVNDDGYDDLIVGSSLDDNTGSNAGSAKVFSGQNGTVLHTFDGDSAGDRFGVAVAGAGDVNADGYDDLIVGAYADDDNGAESGSARIFSGLSGATLHTFYGDSADDRFGRAVAGAGDANDDGYHDLMVGALEDDDGGANAGRARVFSMGYTGTPARARLFGRGCPGSNSHLPTIDYRGRLALGKPIEILLRGALPNTQVALILGGPTDLDLGLQFPGLTGCRLYATLDLSLVYYSTDADGMTSFSGLTVPNNAGLLGIPLNAQWGCLDLAANPIGVVGSNGLEMVVGY